MTTRRSLRSAPLDLPLAPRLDAENAPVMPVGKQALANAAGKPKLGRPRAALIDLSNVSTTRRTYLYARAIAVKRYVADISGRGVPG